MEMRGVVKFQWRVMLSLLAVLTLVLAACGDGSGEQATAPDDQTQAETADDTTTPDVDDATEAQTTGEGDVEALDPPETVTLAYVPIMKFATAYVAAERGLFEEYGLEVNFERVASGTEAIAFLGEGTVDVGGIALVASTFNAWGQGIDLRIIAPGGLEPEENSPTHFVVNTELSESGEVTSIKDLEGRTVGVSGGPGSGAEYLVAKFLETAGLTIQDVELTNVAQPDMPSALESDALDAALLGSPYAETAIQEGFGISLGDVAEVAPGAMTVAFVASGQFVNERPEVAERFALALMRAARLMQGDDYLSEENIDAYLAYVDTTAEDLREGTPVIYDPDQQIPTDQISDIERVHRENGRTEYDEPVDINTVAETKFMEFARSQLD